MCDKKSDPVLTDYDITINSIHQENMFKGTIAVCIVYAIFAFILVAAAYFSDNIRELLFDKFLPFTLVYIIGTIVIIMIFIYFIVSFVPKKVDNNKIDDSISCPDYWKLEILDDKAIEKSFDINNYNKKLFKYRCVMDDDVFNKGTIYKQDKNTAKVNEEYRLGNKPAFIGKVGTGTSVNGDTKSGNYNDIFNDDDPGTNFLTNTKDNDKYYYLYKNLNAYNNLNLIYTNNNKTSDKILDELKESALIMNNYKHDNTDKTAMKYVDITNAGINNYNANNTNLNNRYTSNYYNSPAILTWAASDAYNVVDKNSKDSRASTSYRNTAIVSGDNTNYTATVYDWSTMTNKTQTGNVYAIDLTYTTTTNYVLLGEIKNDNNNNLYFEGKTTITIPASTFVTETTNYNYYFDKTYFLKSNPTNPITNTTLPNLMSGTGPKIRIFHKTERDPSILKNDITKDDPKKLNIPLTCSAVYPSFLASKEDKFSENNTLRCAYSKICNIPWSDLHCNEISLQ